ncbi:MAG: hypothetical protein IPP42_17665 [Saprospiraceae bacterium]|nr:hypothetical protein [Saprospiraceae bacterium]
MKNLLVVRITPDIHDVSIAEIYCHAHHYNIQPSHVDVSSLDELRVALTGRKLDYLYFAGHGDETCFTDNKLFATSWDVIGRTICEANCLNNNSIIMLYCCKGGINTVAYQLIAECKQIAYICGAKQNMKSIDLIIGFNIFLYSIENRNISPVISAHKATLATDIEFECFDRITVESNPRYYYGYCKDCPKPLEQLVC